MSIDNAWEAVCAFRKKHSFGVTFTIVMIVMVLLWLWWGVKGSSQFLKLICTEGEDCEKISSLGALGDIFGGINALFAGLALGAVALSTNMARKAFVEERQWIRDEKFVEQVQRSFEWAYVALTDNVTQASPEPNSLRWERCARHLIRAKRIQSQVKTKELITVLDEYEEHWRYRFSEAMEFDTLEDPKYFEELNGGPKRSESETITSAMFISNFVNQKPKPVAVIWMQRTVLEATGNYKRGKVGRGLTAYLLNAETLRKQERERREQELKEPADQQK